MRYFGGRLHIHGLTDKDLNTSHESNEREKVFASFFMVFMPKGTLLFRDNGNMVL